MLWQCLGVFWLGLVLCWQRIYLCDVLCRVAGCYVHFRLLVLCWRFFFGGGEDCFYCSPEFFRVVLVFV